METPLELDINELREFVLDVPDFPKTGIIFKDITPVLSNGSLFNKLIKKMSSDLPISTTKLVAIESRGFIFASALAQQTGLGFVLARKPGKLPRKTKKIIYDLEYGQDSLEIHEGDLSPKDQVVIIDDVLATGGTACAVESLCGSMGARVLGSQFVIEIAALNGREKLKNPYKAYLVF